jgi:hypothetical protein
MQTMRSSAGVSSLGRSAKESGPNRVSHQGQFSRGIGDGLPLGSALNCRTFVCAESERPSPFFPKMLGVAAFPTQRPISKGQSPYRFPPSRRSSSRAHTSPAARELVQGEQAQRIAHDHAHPGPGESLLARVAQPPQHHRERGQAQVRLGLAAARRKEEQIHRFAVGPPDPRPNDARRHRIAGKEEPKWRLSPATFGRTFAMQEPEYVRAPDGIRFSDTQGRLGLPLHQGLALVYDREEGVVLRHGDAHKVDEFYQRVSRSLRGTTIEADIVMLVVDLDQLTPAILTEVNRAIQITGYLAGNAGLLGAPDAG